MLYSPIEMICILKRMRENKTIQFISENMSQVTNLQTYTLRKTVNRRDQIHLAKFKSCGAKTNKGGINLNIELMRRKLEQIQIQET